MTRPIRLFHYWRSSSSWRVRWALEHKGVRVRELVSVDLTTDASDQPDHRKRNPMAFVPVLEFLDVPESSPMRFLSESVAIIEWLEEILPKPALFPSDPVARGKVRQLVEIINSGTQPLQNPNVGELHSADPEERKRWNQHWIRNGLAAYQDAATPHSGRFSFGDSITAADLFLIPQCRNANRNDIDVADYPLLARIVKDALETPACLASSPERYQPASS
jgi:maleylacetoacetate isomerase